MSVNHSSDRPYFMAAKPHHTIYDSRWADKTAHTLSRQLVGPLATFLPPQAAQPPTPPGTPLICGQKRAFLKPSGEVILRNPWGCLRRFRDPFVCKPTERESEKLITQPCCKFSLIVARASFATPVASRLMQIKTFAAPKSWPCSIIFGASKIKLSKEPPGSWPRNPVREYMATLSHWRTNGS